MNQTNLWLYVALLGILTFGIRWSFLAGSGGGQVHPALQSMMQFIPAAVFASLSIPPLVFVKSGAYLFHDPERLVAGLVGLIVAYRSRNVLVTISAGMGTLWMMRLVFQG